jgi:hypothetical protein
LNIAYFLLFYIPLRAVIASRINSGSPDNRHTLEIAAQRNFETTFISVAGNVIAMTMVTIGNMSSSTVTVVIMSMSAGFSVKLNTLALLYVTKNAWNFPRICVNAPASNVAVTPEKGELAKVRSDTISTPRSQVGEVGKATSDTPSTPTSQVWWLCVQLNKVILPKKLLYELPANSSFLWRGDRALQYTKGHYDLLFPLQFLSSESEAVAAEYQLSKTILRSFNPVKEFLFCLIEKNSPKSLFISIKVISPWFHANWLTEELWMVLWLLEILTHWFVHGEGVHVTT